MICAPNHTPCPSPSPSTSTSLEPKPKSTHTPNPSGNETLDSTPETRLYTQFQHGSWNVAFWHRSNC